MATKNYYSISINLPDGTSQGTVTQIVNSLRLPVGSSVETSTSSQDSYTSDDPTKPPVSTPGPQLSDDG